MFAMAAIYAAVNYEDVRRRMLTYGSKVPDGVRDSPIHFGGNVTIYVSQIDHDQLVFFAILFMISAIAGVIGQVLFKFFQRR